MWCFESEYEVTTVTTITESECFHFLLEFEMFKLYKKKKKKNHRLKFHLMILNRILLLLHYTCEQ